MPDVLLINPSWDGRISKRGGRFNRSWPPLDLLNLASLLKAQGATVELADARAIAIPPSKLKAMASRAETVFLTSSPLDRWQCPNLEIESFNQLARFLAHSKLVLLGVHGTIQPDYMLKQSQAWTLVRGESENAAKLAKSVDRNKVPGAAWLNDGKLELGPDYETIDLTELPLPAFELAPPELYQYEVLGGDFALLETSRGCPFHCRFCLKAMYGQGVRYKNIDRVLAEVEAIARLGARHFYFMDLEFTANRERTLMLCHALTAMNHGLTWCCQTRVDTIDSELLAALREAGCRLVHYGIESGSLKILENLGKKITPAQAIWAVKATHRAGMNSACFFMFGFPGENDTDRGATLKLANSLPAGLASFHIATPYPTTSLSNDCPGIPLWSELDTKHFDRHQLELWIRKAYLYFYLRPHRLAKLLHWGGLRMVRKGGKLLMGFLR